MRAELDICLENPIEEIDLKSICKELPNSYNIVHYAPNHYIIINDELNKSRVRIHDDGRIYVKMDVNFAQNKSNILNELIAEMNKFIKNTYLANESSFQQELNFSFYGPTAISFYWEMQNELKEIGTKKFDLYNIRTFSSDEDSIHIKLKAVKAFNSETAARVANLL